MTTTYDIWDGRSQVGFRASRDMALLLLRVLGFNEPEDFLNAVGESGDLALARDGVTVLAQEDN